MLRPPLLTPLLRKDFDPPFSESPPVADVLVLSYCLICSRIDSLTNGKAREQGDQLKQNPNMTLAKQVLFTAKLITTSTIARRRLYLLAFLLKGQKGLPVHLADSLCPKKRIVQLWRGRGTYQGVATVY
ncbi:hypothetical protein Tco_0375598 [Tanacetum coccineum]